MRLVDADEAAATAKRLGMEVPWSTRTVLLLLDATPTITQFTVEAIPNNPLTLEELREMDGEPVWFDPLMGRMRLWCSGGGWFDGKNCGKSVFIYRRKPEEGTM